MRIRVLVVDDEPLAREGVLLKLRQEQDMEVVGECENGSQAIEAIARLRPDLVFLDIRMPRLSGFDVIACVGSALMPRVIFLTAYEEHALAAFAHNALDYLLKPIDPQRFQQSLEKARRELGQQQLAEQGARLAALLRQLEQPGGAPERSAPEPQRLTVKSGSRTYFLRPQDIDWIEAEGDYVTVHTSARAHLLRETMRVMEQKLAGHGFARIHRSTIVNLDRISELVATSNGEQELRLQDGTALRLGRAYREALHARLMLDPEAD